MKKVQFIYIIILLLLSQSVYGGDKDVYFPFSVTHRVKTFYGDGAKKEFGLGSYSIVKDSASVYINGFPIKPERRYSVDYARQTVVFFDAPPKGSVISVRYKIYPVTLKKSYYHRKYFTAIAPPEEKYVVHSVREDSPQEFSDDEASITKSGSLVRGFSFHTDRGMTMNSGFRMDLKGDIGRNLEVIASLTDQNSPLQPEGNTQTLNEIDRIFFKIRGKEYETTLGDLNLDYNGTEFSNYHRKLQGVSGTWKYGSQSVNFSAAVSKGKFNTNQFTGTEGNQGPYQLKGKNGERYIVVIGGTEKVYIDGEVMRRGEDNDYVIEYGNGQITFTRHRLITDESRIEVDFQYTDGNSKENMYAVKTGGKFGRGFSYNMTFIEEKTALDEQTHFSLADIDFSPTVLEKLKNDNSVTYQSGVSYVGIGKGDYNKVDSLGVVYYSYAGDGLGEYNVSFTDVGEGTGDYEYERYGVYRWAGRGKGRYLPLIGINKENARRVGDLRFDFNPNETLRINSEFAMSSSSNQIPGNPGAKKNGGAVNLGLSLTPKEILFNGIDFGKVNISSRYKKRGENFYSIDRTKEVEYNRKWDLGSSESSGEEELELNTVFSPRPYVSLDAGMGRFSTGESVKSDRNSMQFNFSHASLPKIFYQRESITSRRDNNNYSGDWVRERGNVVYNIGPFKPVFKFERENKKEMYSEYSDSGFKFSDVSGRLEYKRGNSLSTFGEFRTRKDKEYIGTEFMPSSQSYTKNVGMNFRRGSNFYLSANFIQRDKKFEDEREDVKTTLGDLRSKYSTKNRGIVIQNDYQLSSERVPRKARIYFQVEEGKGDYSLNEETGEYFPDRLGSYITRSYATNEFRSVTGIRFGSTLDINASKLLTGKDGNVFYKTVQGIKTKSVLRLEEKSENKADGGIFKIPTFSGSYGDGTFLGNVSLIQDLILFENIKRLYMKVRYNYSSSDNNQFIERSEERDFVEKSVEIKANITKNTGVLADVKDKTLVRTFSDSPLWGRDIVSRNARVEFFYKPAMKVEYKLRFKYGNESNNSLYNTLDLYYLSCAPSFRYAFTRKGRLTGEFEWFKVKTEPEVNTLFYEMAEGRRPGDNFKMQVQLQYRIANHITARVEYSGYKENRGVYHIGTVEMRAYFLEDSYFFVKK